MNAKKPEPTAAQTYAARRNDIARLIDVLEEELKRHGTEASADWRNWGFAGDLSRVRQNLIEAVSAISSTNAEDIEEFLAE